MWRSLSGCSAGILAGVLLALTLPAQAQPQPVIRVDVNLVRVLATVKNPTGDPVGTLEKSDFQIYDNGKLQDIAVFDRQSSQPLSVAILIDTSGSTAKELKYETESVTRFLKALLAGGNREDMAALYAFNWEVRKLQHFTPNFSTLERALHNLKAEAGTSLFDAIYLAGRQLDRREGRRIMVIVTDGGDTTSSTDSHVALEAAQLAGTVIYPVVVMPITNEAGRNIGGENVLTYMAQGTGGRTFMPSVGAQLDRAFADILRDLRTQYLLGFYPNGVPLTRNRFHKLEVKVKNPDLRVSARNGYYGEAEGTSSTPDARISVAPAAVPKRQEK